MDTVERKTTETMTASMTKMQYTTEDHSKRTLMTMADITNKLHEEFEDEIEGANNYLSMAISAYEMEHLTLAEYLSAIAKDEFSHATFIHNFLEKSGVAISEEHAKAFKELEERFRKEFR
jgi:ferritin